MTYLKVFLRHVSEGTGENEEKKLRQNNRSLGLGFVLGPPVYEAGVLNHWAAILEINNFPTAEAKCTEKVS